MNQEPENVFNFKVNSPRWGHPDTYRLRILDEGWRVDFISICGDCDAQGEPYLYRNLEHDSIDYPASLKREMESLFLQAKEGSLTNEEIQDRLDRLGQWVSEVDAVTKPNF